MVPAKVLFVYVFGIVVDACTKAVAEVVENAAPWFCDKKNASDVVENPRPNPAHEFSDVVLNARPSDEKYEADVVENAAP